MTAPTTTMLAYIPSPPQGVWYIGSFPLRAYALCIIVGIIVAVWWGNRRWIARGGRSGEVLDVAIWAVPFGLIGGRIYHVLTDWQIYFGDGGKTPIDALKIWDGGLGIWGAVLFGGLGAWIGARRMGIKLPPFADAIAPPILLAQAIGRLGNYFNQELYGRPTDVPWGLKIYERVDASGQADPGLITGVSNGHVVAIVHPTFLYELLWNLLVVVILVLVDRYFRIGHGRLFALYVVGYCIGRFGVELMRSDPAFTHIAGVRINVFTAALGIVCGAIYFIVAPKGREQGLEVYWPERAAELAELGHTGALVDDVDDDDEYDDVDDDGENDDGEDENEHFFDDEPDADGDDGAEHLDGSEPDDSDLEPDQRIEPQAASTASSTGGGVAAAGAALAGVAVAGTAAGRDDRESDDHEDAGHEDTGDEDTDGEGADHEVDDHGREAAVDASDSDDADAPSDEGVDAETSDEGVEDEVVEDGAAGPAEAESDGTESDGTEPADSEPADSEPADAEPADSEPTDAGTAGDETVEDGGESTDTAGDHTDEGVSMSSAAEGIGPEEIAEGVSEDIEDMVDDEGDTSASGVDEDEAELADGQEINAGGPDPVLDENEEIVSKIIPGTGESADAKPWDPEDDPARPEGVTTESEILEESDSDSDTDPGDTADVDAADIEEGIAEEAEDAEVDDGPTGADGVDEDEGALADGQMDNAGGPDPVADDDYVERDKKIIPGTGESADAKPWKPGDQA
nr:prolipoprotein diacylglyceryl transferase [Gordonia aichiensis]